MVTKAQIRNFLEPRKLAIAGVSRNPKKFGYAVFNELKQKGYTVYPVNPNTGEMGGDTCYATVSELPDDVKHLLIVTPRTDTDAVLHEAIQKGITHVWVQQMSETPDTVQIAEAGRVDVITRKCIFMFADPVKGVHKFHRTCMGLFGRLPK
jgi:uncharacterized protein